MLASLLVTTSLSWMPIEAAALGPAAVASSVIAEPLAAKPSGTTSLADNRRNRDRDPADDADNDAEDEAQRETDRLSAAAEAIAAESASLDAQHDVLKSQFDALVESVDAVRERQRAISNDIAALRAILTSAGARMPEDMRAQTARDIRDLLKEKSTELPAKLRDAEVALASAGGRLRDQMEEINLQRENASMRYNMTIVQALSLGRDGPPKDGAGAENEPGFDLDYFINRVGDRLDAAWGRAYRAAEQGPEALLAANGEIASLARDLDDLRALRDAIARRGAISPAQTVSDYFPELEDGDSPFDLGPMKDQKELLDAANSYISLTNRVDAVTESLLGLERMLKAQQRAAEAEAVDTRELARGERGAERDRLIAEAERLDRLAGALGARADAASLEAKTLLSRSANAGIRFADAVAAMDAAQAVRLPATIKELEERNRDMFDAEDPPRRRQTISLEYGAFAGANGVMVRWGEAANDPAFLDAEDADPADDPEFQDAEEPSPADDPAFRDAEDTLAIGSEVEFLIIRTREEEEIILRPVRQIVEIVEVDDREPVVEVVDIPEPEPVVEWLVVGEEPKDGARKVERRVFQQQVEIVNAGDEALLQFEVVGEINADEIPAAGFDQAAVMHRAFLAAEAAELGIKVDPAADALTLANAVLAERSARRPALRDDRRYIANGLASAEAGNVEESVVASYRRALARKQDEIRENTARVRKLRKDIATLKRAS